MGELKLFLLGMLKITWDNKIIDFFLD